MASRPITMDEHILLMKTMNENHDGFFKRNEQIIEDRGRSPVLHPVLHRKILWREKVLIA